MYGAQGVNASVEYITKKGSANVEVLRDNSHRVAEYFGLLDPHRRHSEVNVDGDIAALRLDLEKQRVHYPSAQPRRVPAARTGKKKPKKHATTAVKDVLLEGMKGLGEGGLFERWKKRTDEDDADEEEVGGGEEAQEEGEAEEGGEEVQVEDGEPGGLGFEDEEGAWEFEADFDDISS